jgi:hypothetical protein
MTEEADGQVVEANKSQDDIAQAMRDDYVIQHIQSGIPLEDPLDEDNHDDEGRDEDNNKGGDEDDNEGGDEDDKGSAMES